MFRHKRPAPRIQLLRFSNDQLHWQAALWHFSRSCTCLALIGINQLAHQANNTVFIPGTDGFAFHVAKLDILKRSPSIRVTLNVGMFVRRPCTVLRVVEIFTPHLLGHRFPLPLQQTRFDRRSLIRCFRASARRELRFVQSFIRRRSVVQNF